MIQMDKTGVPLIYIRMLGIHVHPVELSGKDRDATVRGC